MSHGWWRHAVVYQVYIRSFADGDGDGVGDLNGITARLPHLQQLGVDALWVTPFYASPQYDHGYDVADYCDVDELFGTLADADALVARAHELGLRVLVDLVPNHTSSAHEWFQAALAAEPGSRERARYLFRTGKGPRGDQPPNNWGSVFGGPAWTRVGQTDQWYLHLFDTTQPDLDWRNPEVPEMFERVLRFWLGRGVDGFRVDVAHGLFKEPELRDQVLPQLDPAAANQHHEMVERHLNDEPMWDQPEVHEIYRRWHDILDEYGDHTMAVGEAWTQTQESMARFVRSDELDQSFNFAWLLADWSAAAFTEVISSTLESLAEVGAAPTWVLSNHDVIRHPTRYGGGQVGLARARAATVAMLALPGSCYLYQGEELGLEQVDVAPEHRQDPAWIRGGETGRDGCRVPIPWSGTAPPYGFGPEGSTPWIPQPPEWAELSVEAQTGVPDSTLELYRTALKARREVAAEAEETVHLLDLGADVLAFRRGTLVVVLNCGSEPVPLPELSDGELLLCSAGPDAIVDSLLPPDTCAWLL